MRGIIKKLKIIEETVMQWHTQAGNITTNLKVKIDFNLPEFSLKKIVTCDFHVNDFFKSRYDMTLGRYILTALGLNLKLSEHISEADDGPLKRSTTPMIELCTYEFKDLNTGKITP